MKNSTLKEAISAAFDATLPNLSAHYRKVLAEALRSGPDPVNRQRPAVFMSALWLIWAQLEETGESVTEVSHHHLIPPCGMDGVKVERLESFDLREWQARFHWDTASVESGKVEPLDPSSFYYPYEVVRLCLQRATPEALSACASFARAKQASRAEQAALAAW